MLSEENKTVASLAELTARCVASHIPFELVEHVYPPVPEQLQLRIAFWSFPDNEEDIRLYSCLANGNADEYSRGEVLYRTKAVRDPLQIGKFFNPLVLNNYAAKPYYSILIFFFRFSSKCKCSSSSGTFKYSRTI